MARQVIDLGAGPSPPNAASTETAYSANVKNNANFAEVYGALFDTESVSQFPSVLRGTVSLHKWPNVTMGTSIGSTARQANLTAINAALSYAATNRKFIEAPPGDYEIEGTGGIVIPQTKNSGFAWRGTKGSHFKQFSNNCPIFTIGDVSAVGANTEQASIIGLRASYAADQSANQNSTAIRIGNCRNCTYGEWNVFADATASGYPVGSSIRAYRGVVMQSAATSMSYFSNTMRDIMIMGCARNFLAMGLDTSVAQDGSTITGGGGTGNIFHNVYMANGVTGTPQPIGEHALRLRGQADLYESVWEQINIEWTQARYLVFAEILRNASWLSWHLEGNQLTGADPAAFYMSGSQVNFSGLNFLDLKILNATATGTPSILYTYGECHFNGQGLALHWSGSGNVDRVFQLVNVTSWTPNDNPIAVNLDGLYARDAGGGNLAARLQIDGNLPVANFPAPSKVDYYRWSPVLPDVIGAHVRLTADQTIYGCHRDPLITYPATLGAARTLVLATTMKASGSLSTVAVPTGALAIIRRGPGTADGFSLTVKNATTGGTTLGTLSTADSVLYCRYNGTAWVAVT